MTTQCGARRGASRENRIPNLHAVRAFPQFLILQFSCEKPDRLALMKPTAIVINTARGPVVEQRAIYEALRNGIIAGAGLDVFEIEPAPADEPLFALDNVICTPHALCWTDECFRLNGEADVQAVLDLMQGRVPRGIVHRGIVDNRDWQRKLVGFKSRFGADPER